MTNQEKLEALKSWLTENGYRVKENHMSKSCGVLIETKVVHPRVAIKIGDDNDFYYKVRGKYSPLFIRDTDTVEFVIEKMQNCINSAFELISQRKAAKEIKKAQKEANIRKQQEMHEAALARKAEKHKAWLEARRQKEKPKRKRQRIVRYERV